MRMCTTVRNGRAASLNILLPVNNIFCCSNINIADSLSFTKKRKKKRYVLLKQWLSAVMADLHHIPASNISKLFPWVLVWSEFIPSPMAGVDLTDSSSAAGADDFDPITRNPTGQQVTIAMATVTGAPRREREIERCPFPVNVTGDHVTRADSPYIVTLQGIWQESWSS